MNSFAVYHQVYSNKTETISSLNQFRKIYPDVNYYLISDGGDDHSDIASQYNCIYIHSNFRTGLWSQIHPDVISGSHCRGWNKTEYMEILKRWVDICKLDTADYIFISEDDIFVTRPIQIINENFNYTRIYPGNGYSESTKKYLRQFYPDHKLSSYGTCGGNFINRKFFLECYNKTIEFLNDHYDKIKEIEYHFGWIDSNFGLIFSVCGDDGISNVEYSEKDSSYPIYHSREKQHYRWYTLYNQIR